MGRVCSPPLSRMKEVMAEKMAERATPARISVVVETPPPEPERARK